MFQQHFQLHFTPGAARLDIGQHTLEITHADGQLLHLTQTLMDFFQTVRNQLEGFAQALFQRRMQLFIDGLAHLFEAVAIVQLQILDLGFQRGAHFGHTLCIRFGQCRQGLIERIAKALQ